MTEMWWRLLLAVILGSATAGRGGTGASGAGGGRGGGSGGGGGGLAGALGALGTLGSGPLDAVVGPRLMARLVEGEAVRRVAQAAERECCGVTHDPTTEPLRRKYFDGASRAVCNDNSPAGFYFRRSHNSRRWIVFLEGGWYCFDRQSCEQRWRGLHPLMTSRGWPETRQVGGILSPDPEINPHWWTANHVFVPYCSSDSWSGTRFSADGSGGFSFMGSVIVEEVVEELVKLNLTNGHKLILSGSSAGGVGAMVNVDRVAQQLTDKGITADVRAVSDSGWFLDNEPFAPLECLNAQSCPPVEAIKRGQELWQGRIPNSCLQEYPQHPWYCYFGYRAYPTMKSPLFVFQWVFDEAQMTADNVGKPISKEQWDYIHGIGERLRKTFENVTALFAPSCISHTVLTRRDWSNIKIGDVSLPQALYCWDVTPKHTLNNRSHQRHKTTSEEPSVAHHRESHDRTKHHSRHRHRSKRRRERGKSRGKTRRNESEKSSVSSSSRREGGRKRGERTRVKLVERDGDNFTQVVQSSHLVLIRAEAQDGEVSISLSESVPNANQTIDRRDGTGAKQTEIASDSSADSQGTRSRTDVPLGEMLADSPRGSVASRVSAKPYSVESNAIDNPQEDVQKAQPLEETPKKQEAKRDRRRNNSSKKKKRKRNRNKDRRRKKKRRERKRKLRDRRRRQRERRKKKKKKPKGITKIKDQPADRERSARSVFLLHSEQSVVQHESEPATPPANASLSLSGTELLSDDLAAPTVMPADLLSFSATAQPFLQHSNVAMTQSQHQPNSVPVSSSSSSSSLASTIVPSFATHSGSQTGVAEDSTSGSSGDSLADNPSWNSEMCPANSLHLTDHCAWPHCNYACPKLLNPFTGEEMNFKELLKSFGLDMASVANALGIDIHTLNSMGNDELLMILTQ